MDPLRIIVRVLVAYLFVLVMVRLSGHREIKQLDIQSFIVALIVGDLFDDFFWLEVPAAQFVIAVTSLFVLHIAASLHLYHSGRRTWRESWR
jgi:uncharacterized membrane protein YcaP (DUF421 family)